MKLHMLMIVYNHFKDVEMENKPEVSEELQCKIAQVRVMIRVASGQVLDMSLLLEKYETIVQNNETLQNIAAKESTQRIFHYHKRHNRMIKYKKGKPATIGKIVPRPEEMQIKTESYIGRLHPRWRKWASQGINVH